MTIRMISVLVLLGAIWGCSDNGSSATTSTSSLQLPQQLEVVTNETE